MNFIYQIIPQILVVQYLIHLLFLAYGSTNNRGSLVFLTETQVNQKVGFKFKNQLRVQNYKEINQNYKDQGEIQKLIPTVPIPVPADNVSCAYFSPNGQYLAIIGQIQGQGDQLIIYELQNCSDFWNQFQKILQVKVLLPLQNNEISCLCFTGDGNFIILGTISGSLLQIKISTEVPTQLAFSSEIKIRQQDIKEVKILNGQILSIDVSSDSYMIFVQGHQEIGFLIKQIQKQGDKIKYLKGGKINKCNGKIVQCKDVEECEWKEQENKEQPLFLPKGLEKHLIGENLLRTIYSIPLYKRQLAISPDSNFIVFPSGINDVENEEGKPSCTFSSYILTRKSLCTSNKNFDIILPGYRYPSTTVVFSDKLYKLDENKPNISNLTYRMIFAVLAGTDIYIYDTQTFDCLLEYQGVNYQQDYVYSVAFDSQTPQLLVFGSHYQFQKINFGQLNLELIDQPRFINISQKYKMFLLALQHQKYNYAVQLACYYNKKRKTRPSKPNQVYLGELKQDNQHIPPFSMSNMFQYDTLPPHQIQIDREELEYIWNLDSIKIEQDQNSQQVDVDKKV